MGLHWPTTPTLSNTRLPRRACFGAWLSHYGHTTQQKVTQEGTFTMGGYKWGAYLPGGLVLQPHYPVQGGCCTIQCSRTIQCMVTQEGPLTSGGCTCPAQPHYPVQMGVALSSADRGKLDYPVHSCTTQLSWHFPVRKKLKHAKSTDCDSIQHRNTIHCRAAFQKVLL